MMYVHVPTGDTQEIIYDLNPLRPDYWIEAFLVEGPGRSGAALLSVVSGYLAATLLMEKKRSLLTIYRRRFMSILVPMVLWALVTCVIYTAFSGGQPTFVDEASTWLDYANLILFLTHTPYGATMHLGFLRDLFVCVLLSPLLLTGVRRFAVPLLVILAATYLFEHEQRLVVILRPLIVFGFALGMFIAVRGFCLAVLDRYCLLFCFLAVASTLSILWVNSGGLTGAVVWFEQHNLSFQETVLYPASRLFGSLAIWTVIPLLSANNTQQILSRFSPYVFAAFCSHTLLLTIVFHAAWRPLLGDRQAAAYLVWFLSAPVLALVMAIAVVHLCNRVLPSLATLITGGRLIVTR